MTYLEKLLSTCTDIIISNNRKEKYLNERSVQMKLAFELWKEKNIEPELEKCFNYTSTEKTYTDIFLNDILKIGIEIKFKTRKVEGFEFIDQKAVTNGKLNALVDISRLLKLKHEKEIDIGYFIFITNDYLYWQKSKSSKNNSNEFSFEQGKKIKTHFPKPDWSSRTYQHSIDLREITTKNIMWRGHDYGKKRNSFRFFIVEI